ncbi:MAG: hypothetical protein DRQ54_04685 [Gammaproteobacteria bacterium]|nr:MAG: hypothetical protein DRQ54_04685 [Gammaproteobacteria bacterium]
MQRFQIWEGENTWALLSSGAFFYTVFDGPVAIMVPASLIILIGCFLEALWDQWLALETVSN